MYLSALASLTGISTQAKEKMSSETTQQRPNIILFMVDDMGWQDTSLPFWTQKTHYNETYETPNMERLAQKRDDVHTGIRLQYQFRYPLQSDNGCQQHPTSCNKLDAWKKTKLPTDQAIQYNCQTGTTTESAK